MILTAIVITMGIAAFVLALIYRSFRLAGEKRFPTTPRTPGIETARRRGLIRRRRPAADDRVGDSGVGERCGPRRW